MPRKQIIIYGLLVFVLLSASACSLEKKKTENWQDEILLAQDCGEEGLMCCADMDPACKYGSCCVDPNDATKNYCSESCEFGKKDTFCLAGNECDKGLACSEGYCRECGGKDQPCCGDKACSETSLACFRGNCVTCGETDNPCCASEPYCRLSGAKGLERAECEKSLCTTCGANGNKPCQVEPFCNENHLLNNDKCYRCGGFNQPCCQKVTYEKTEKYCVEEGLECRLDFCSK